MASSFGTTWWGKRWLNALSHIDYSNRLPRGARYARNGMVSKVDIKGGTIQAKVRGSRPTPYRVTISIPQFSSREKADFMTELQRQPAIVSKLLNRELDPAVMDIARKVGMKVFPEKWDDLKMSCSCPDWAVPCKHLAATIYMVCQEIDNNPFLIFQLHGLDILKELNRMGMVQTTTQLKIRDIASCFIPNNQEGEQPHEDFRPIDYTTLDDLTPTLPALLEPSPAFYGRSDFQKIYANSISRVSKAMTKVYKHDEDLTELLSVKRVAKLDRREIYRLEVNYQSTGTDKQLLATLSQLPLERLEDYPQHTIVLRQCLTAAMQLIMHGAIIPEIVTLRKKGYAIRWTPAMMDEKVQHIVETLDRRMPADLLRLKVQGHSAKETYCHQAELSLSAMIGTLVPCLLAKTYRQDEMTDFFFGGALRAFDGVGEKNIPGGIKAWLDRFAIHRSNLAPIIVMSPYGKEQFAMDICFKTAKNESPVALHKLMTDDDYTSQRLTAMQDLAQLSHFIGGIDGYVNSLGTETVIYYLQEMGIFLMKVMPVMKLLGIQVTLPRELKTIVHPHVSMRISSKQDQGKSYIRLDDLLQFDWRVAIGSEVISVEDFEQLIRRATGLIRFREQYIYVSPEDIARINKALQQDKPCSTAELLQTVLSGEYNAAPVEITDEVKALIRQLTAESSIPIPTGINATLRPYQQRGFSWMYRNLKIGFGSIIADDMGLGKTLQVITLIQQLKDDGALSKAKVLIVVPTGLLLNWQQELTRFAPTLSAFIYHGPNRNLKAFDADILLTSYGTLRSDVAQLKKMKWQLMVIDEAQNIKNDTTAQTKAVKSIKAAGHIAMSGTPVENRLSEFWSIMDFADKGYLGTAKKFKDVFANPIQQNGDEKVAERFRRITAPFMMRRLKTDKTIINDLPDKIEENEWATLTSEQTALYQQTLQTAMAEIESIDDDEAGAMFKRQGLVLQMIMALKQICNHPTLFLKNDDLRPELSGKMQMLLDLVEGINDSDEKVLIFTQFREMGELLRRCIADRIGEEPLFLHGGCTIRQRQEMISRFQNNRADRVFILSLKAAGTGLNLTRATQVIHYDLWWNPAVEAQATDRAYRIGQHKNVIVHRFITRNTFEERIDQMIQDKKHLADMTVATGESWIGKLSNKELKEIVEMQ